MKMHNPIEEKKENIIKLGELLQQLEGKSKATSEQLTLMFNLHNYFNPKHQEYAKFCNSCVARVYRNIKVIYEKVKDEFNT
jgi:hypothetical protein